MVVWEFWKDWKVLELAQMADNDLVRSKIT